MFGITTEQSAVTPGKSSLLVPCWDNLPGAAVSGCTPGGCALSCASFAPEWRNWYTHQTQNLASFTAHVGSSPTSGTTHLRRYSNRANIAGLTLRFYLYKTRPGAETIRQSEDHLKEMQVWKLLNSLRGNVMALIVTVDQIHCD